MLPYIAYMDPMMFGNSVWMLLRFQAFLGVRNGGLFFFGDFSNRNRNHGFWNGY